MGQNTRKVVKISKRKVLFVVVIVMSLIAWYGSSYFTQVSRTGISSYGNGSADLMLGKPESVNIGGSTANSVSKMMPPDNIISNQQISINDTREFLKTSYSANIKTRDVQSVVSSAKNIVKGNDGRIDNLSSSEKSGYLTFVVPKSKFETFRKEIEALTHKKLFSETNTSQNLLNQKQSIEEQTSRINDSLESLQQQKESLQTKHAQSVASINKELSSIRSQLSEVRKTIEGTQDQDTLNSLRSQENTLVTREATQKQKLNTENNSYSVENTNLDNQIKNQNTNLLNVNKQDTKFSDNIETVDGYISVNWISVWEMIRAFSPIAPEILIALIVIIFWIILAKLNYVPKFTLE